MARYRNRFSLLERCGLGFAPLLDLENLDEDLVFRIEHWFSSIQLPKRESVRCNPMYVQGQSEDQQLSLVFNPPDGTLWFALALFPLSRPPFCFRNVTPLFRREVVPSGRVLRQWENDASRLLGFASVRSA